MTLAVPKGALFDEGVRLLRAAGLETGVLEEGGRRLVAEAGDVRFILARPADVPVYVAYGAADVGIVGKDALAEAGMDVAELLDLGFGECRFVVAEPEDAAERVEEHYDRTGVIRVATKYPRVTEEYFASRGVQVEIVKLHGNIEVAPLIGLADRVVDVTATGRTLAENRLRVVDEIMASTARLVANRVALRTRAERIDALTAALAALVSGEEGEGA